MQEWEIWDRKETVCSRNSSRIPLWELTWKVVDWKSSPIESPVWITAANRMQPPSTMKQHRSPSSLPWKTSSRWRDLHFPILIYSHLDLSVFPARTPSGVLEKSSTTLRIEYFLANMESLALLVAPVTIQPLGLSSTKPGDSTELSWLWTVNSNPIRLWSPVRSWWKFTDTSTSPGAIHLSHTSFSSA